MIASSRSYAIGMVHFQIGGGWKVVIIVLSVYLALFGGGVALYYYGEYMSNQQGPPLGKTLGPVLVALLMGLQVFALLLVGGYRVSSSIRHDISSRMIESHRLMPISNSNAVFGYLFGPTMPVIMFALLNLALSIAFGASVGVSLPRMVLNQGVIFAFAAFFWSLIGLSTFIYRHMFFIGLAGMFLGTCTGLLLYSFLVFPALSLLMTPFMGETIFNVGGGIPTFDAGYGEGIAGQAALFALLFAGACRLYRGTYPTIFTSRQALAILGIWAVLSATGIYQSDRIGLQHLFFGNHGGYDDAQGTLQVVASIAACIVVAVIPIWSFLQEQKLRQSNIVIRVAFVAVVSVLVGMPAWGAGWMQTANLQTYLITMLAAAAQVVTLYAVLRMVQSLRFIIAMLITGAVFLLLWIVPLVLELARVIVLQQGGNRPDSISFLGTFSPLGHLGALWSAVEVSPIPGLIAQWIVAGISVAISILIARRKLARSKPPVQPAITSLPPQSEPSAPLTPPV